MYKYSTTCAFLIACFLSLGLFADNYDYDSDFEDSDVECFDFEANRTVYWGVFGGFDQLFINYDRATISYNPKFMGGFCLGVNFLQYFRLEGEFAYRKSLLSFPTHGIKLDVYSGMSNLCLDLPVGKWTPYLGGGIGYAKTLVTVVPTYEYGVYKKTEEAFAWQLFYGLNYKLCEKTDLGMRWTFFSGDRDKVFHESLSLCLNRYF